MPTGPRSSAPPTAAVVEPVPRGLQRVLRRAVVDHAAAERRRVFAPVVHVGLPGRVTATWGLGATGEPGESGGPGEPLDHALRVDVLEAMLRRVRRPGPGSLVWLTRPVGPSPLDPSPLDAVWLSAARSAGAELGIWLPMVVVTRRGWHDPQSGVGRTWARIRPGRERTPG